MKPATRKWFDIAESDYDSSLYLYEGARYPQAIYFICQAIEKLLKAIQIEISNTAPKKIHRLENLAQESGISFSKTQYDLLTDLSKHYSRVRYPDISKVSYNTKTKVQPIIDQGKDIYQWIRKKLQNQ